MRRDEDKDSGVYGLVFAITIALFLFVAYQVYRRYLRPAGTRPPTVQRTPPRAPQTKDDGYDRAPSSLPPVRVDGGVTGGSRSR